MIENVKKESYCNFGKLFNKFDMLAKNNMLPVWRLLQIQNHDNF